MEGLQPSLLQLSLGQRGLNVRVGSESSGARTARTCVVQGSTARGWERTYVAFLCEIFSHTQIFGCLGVGTPKPYAVKGQLFLVS